MSFAKHPGLQPCASTRQTVRLSGKYLRCSRGLAFPYFTGGIKTPRMQKHLRGKPGCQSGRRETRLALGCSLQRWATVGRLGSTQSAIGRQFNLVLPNFRHFTISEPIGNRRRLNADRSSDLGLAAKVFKKVIRGHATSISHALRLVQEKYRHNLSNDRYDSIMVALKSILDVLRISAVCNRH